MAQELESALAQELESALAQELESALAQELSIHPDAVRHAIESGRFQRAPLLRPPIADPYLEFVRQTLDRHPRLRATRLYQMIHRRKNLKAH